MISAAFTVAGIVTLFAAMEVMTGDKNRWPATIICVVGLICMAALLVLHKAGMV